MSEQLPKEEQARKDFINHLPTYQRYDAMDLVRQAARLIKEGDEMVIYRDAFRWKNDADNSVLPNHYEMYSVTHLAREFGYDVIHDFQHVAIVKERP